MKSLYHFVTLSFVLVVAAGCSCYRHFPSSQEKVDSVRAVVHDTTIFRTDTVFVEIPVEKIITVLPPSDTSHLETAVAASDSYIDSLGLLHHSLWNKPVKLEKPVLIPEHTVTMETDTFSREKEVVTVEVERKLTPMQLFWQSSGKVAWCVLLIGLLAVAIRIAVKFWLKV